MARSFSRKKRNTATRRQKPLILIIAEGQNVTESQYFRHFQEQHADYNIKILIPGHITDPSGMQKTILRYWDQYGMDEEKGDVAFIVLDLDCNSEKGRLIRKLEKENENARFVVSNPCFEVWFLLHFRYSTRAYYTSSEVIRDLRKYIPDYEKNTDVALLIADDIEIAMKNAEKLRKQWMSIYSRRMKESGISFKAYVRQSAPDCPAPLRKYHGPCRHTGTVITSSILRRKKNTSVFIRDLRLLLFSLRSWMHTGSNTAKGLSRYHTLMTCLCPSFLRLLPGAGTRGITHD